MAAHSIVDEGNATIDLSCSNDPFSDVFTTSYLQFYDEWHRPHFPLTSQVISDHLVTILNESFYPDLWKAGLITDQMEALMENCPQTFRSFLPEERITILQEA